MPLYTAPPGQTPESLAANPSRYTSTKIPADNAAMNRQTEAILKAVLSTPGVDEEIADAAKTIFTRSLTQGSEYISSGPVSFSGKNRMPFVRPQLSQMEPLAEALGLDREGGWIDVWKTMDDERDRLCKLVASTLEWLGTRRAGNTFTYCFCTKYLPRLIAAAIAEPSPSVYASPYDLILRGACSLSLAQYYLGFRPDQAILLRNAYYRKCYRATKMTDSIADVYLQLMPHLLVIHTCVIAYVSSASSTPAQRAPPTPLPKHAARALDTLARKIQDYHNTVEVCKRSTSFSWPGLRHNNLAVFMLAMAGDDILLRFPTLLKPDKRPFDSDFLACRGHGIALKDLAFQGLDHALAVSDHPLECFERDPKKMKACSRCKVVYYCCVEHQKHDWEVGMHKPMCQKIVWDDDD